MEPTDSQGLFITGTDTQVGKTWVTAHVARALRDDGLDVRVWKPVQSGCRYGEAEADSNVLKTISGVDEAEDIICPFSFEAPLTPLLAARLEDRAFTVDDLIGAGVDLLRVSHDGILVEGAGGLAVPLNEDEMVVDLAVRLGFPLLIVARPGLGTINHTLLTVEYARQHGLTVAGVIFDGYDTPLCDEIAALDGLDAETAANDSALTNPMLVRQFGHVEVLGRVPLIPPETSLQERLQTVHSHINLDRIREWLSGKGV